MRISFHLLTLTLFLGMAFLQSASAQEAFEVDNTVDLIPPPTVPRSGVASLTVITTPDGFDNFDLGVDFAEPHMSTDPRNPLRFFNAFNTNGTHHTEDGHTWTGNNPSFPSVAGDPATAYDSLGNLYYMTMKNPITGVWVVKSTNNGATWSSPVSANVGNDKNWMACDQTMGPYANYVYGTMTNSPNGGTFTRSTDGGATFVQTFAPATQALPGMMVCVGANVLGTNVSGGCVYVVTNSGSSFASTYTFYRSTNGGEAFDFMSSQNFAGYVGTNINGRNSVENMRTRPYPFITADNSFGPYRGRLYLVYASNVPAGDGNKPDVFCRYSTNHGATWSLPVTINDDPGSDDNHNWMPAPWCDKETGRLYVKWYDSRNSLPNDDSTDVYASYSDDGGITWVANQRLTNRLFKVDCASCGGGGTPRYQGDYDAITSNNYVSMAVWTDFRNNNFTSMTAYFPDFAMLATPAADTLSLTDSINVLIKIPAVKLYTHAVKFTASVSPAAPIDLEFPNGRDSLSAYPDSLILKVRLNNVPQGVYTVTITGRGPNGTPVHRRTVTLSAFSNFVTLQQPNGGEQIFAGTTYPITWAMFQVDSVKIEYTTDNGATWLLITPGVPARPGAFGALPTTAVHPKLRVKPGLIEDDASALASTYSWLVPQTISTSCRVRISDKNNASIADTSGGTFSIVAPPIAQWRNQTPAITIPLYSVSVVDTQRAYVTGDSGRVYRTLNGGATWVSAGSLTNPVYSIHAVDISRVYAASNAPGNARILRTLSGGLGWQTVYQDSNPSAFINTVKMFDLNNGYAVGDPVNGFWTLLRTTDAGATWVRRDTLAQNGTEAGWNNAMWWNGNQHGWFGTNNGRIYRTTNGGTTWTPSTTSFANSYAVAFADQTFGIAGGNGVTRSTDGGATWGILPAPPSNITGIAPLALTPARWYATAGTTIYKSTDQWSSSTVDFSQANAYQHIAMKIVTLAGNDWLVGYAVGENATITRYLELLVATDIGSPSSTPTTFALEQNYPNPFNPLTQLGFRIAESGFVSLKVYDMLGREVATLVNEPRGAGVYTATWDGTNEAGNNVGSGVYIYRLTTPSFTSTRKMILLR